jgi:thiamine-phosphate pyrophosphorylase
MLHKLQYISQGKLPEDHIKNISEVLTAGVKFVQLRLKNVDENIYFQIGTIAKEICDKHQAMLVINDNPTIAKRVNADAVHLGLDDMSVESARKIFIDDKIIGGTANTYEHVKNRCAENVDYIGLGPFKFTSTKEKLSPVLGIEGYTNIINKMKSDNLHTPIFAIGGIELKDIEAIMKTGVYGIALSGLLTNSNNKEALVKEINKILYHA